MAKSNRLSLSLEDDLYDALVEEAEDQGRPIAEVIRDHLRNSVLGQEKQKPIVELAERLLMGGLTNEAVLEKILEERPEARTSLASIAWYRSNLKKHGKPVISQVQAKRDATS